MRTTILAVILCFFTSSAISAAAASWEVRKKPSGVCEVVRVAAKPAAGTRVAGPFPTSALLIDQGTPE